MQNKLKLSFFFFFFFNFIYIYINYLTIIFLKKNKKLYPIGISAKLFFDFPPKQVGFATNHKKVTQTLICYDV